MAHRDGVAPGAEGRGGTGPIAGETFGVGDDCIVQGVVHREALVGQGDGRGEDLGQSLGAVSAQGAEPGGDHRGDDGGEQPVAGDQVEAEIGEGVQSGGLRSNAAAVDGHVGVVAGRVDQDWDLAGEPVLVGHQHGECEPARNRGVDGVAAGSQDGHCGLRGQVVPGRYDPASALDYWPPAGRACGGDWHLSFLHRDSHRRRAPARSTGGSPLWRARGDPASRVVPHWEQHRLQATCATHLTSDVSRILSSSTTIELPARLW